MKQKLVIIASVLMLAISAAPDAGAQWVQTNGPYGGNVNALAVIGTNLFAGTDRFVYRSTDSGASWFLASNDLMYPIILKLVAIGGKLFSSSFSSGSVSWTSNSGASWAHDSTGLIGWSMIYAKIGSTIFSVNDSVFRSTDNGKSWSAASNGLPKNIIINALTVIDTTLFAATGIGVYLSTNYGTSWSATSSALAYADVQAITSSGSNLFASVKGGAGVFHSNDNGVTWTTSSSGLTTTNVQALAAIGSNIFAGTAATYGLGGGVFRSTNNGVSWTTVYNGMADTHISSLATSGTTTFAGTTAGGIFQSIDGGINWTLANEGVKDTEVNAIAVSGANIFAGTGSGIVLSTDNGATWNTEGSSSPHALSFALNGTDILAGSGSSIFLSADNGSSWVSGRVDANSGVDAIAVNGTNIFAGTGNESDDFGNGIFLSTNNGTSWTGVDTGLTNSDVFSLATIGTNVFAGTGFGGVFLSSDTGASWAAVNSGLTGTYVYALQAVGTNLFAGTNIGVYLTTDSGSSWVDVNQGFIKDDILSLASNGTNIFAGTNGKGVWTRALSDMIAVDAVQPDSPLQNSITAYPNPLSQSTTITFSSPESGVAEVTIVNLLGTEVKRIFSGEIEAGAHSFAWDAISEPPGMYECVVRMNGNSQQIPIILTK